MCRFVTAAERRAREAEELREAQKRAAKAAARKAVKEADEAAARKAAAELARLDVRAAELGAKLTADLGKMLVKA